MCRRSWSRCAVSASRASINCCTSWQGAVSPGLQAQQGCHIVQTKSGRLGGPDEPQAGEAFPGIEPIVATASPAWLE